MEKKRFKSEFAENIFRAKYAQGPDDTWDALSRRVVDDICGPSGHNPALLSEGDRKQLAEYISDFKFVPGGRYLYYAGRQAKFYNNCGVAETKLLTDTGWVQFGDVVGKEVNVYSPVARDFLPAVMHEHGEQPVNEITFAPVRGKSKVTYKVTFTPNHKWPLQDGTFTENLKVGDVVPAAEVFLPSPAPNAWLHGTVFADGNRHILKKGFGHQLRLCGKKSRYVDCYEGYHKVTYPKFANGDPIVYIKSDFDMKQLPTTKDPAYIAEFIRGWVTFDGSANNWLHSVDEEAIDWFIENAPLAGFIITGVKKVVTKPSNFGERKPLYHIRFQEQEDFSGFKVVNIEPKGIQKVYCPFEPLHNRIVIDHGIDTYQCYLLRAEEDTREEWSAVTWRAMSCLMTGGGIGIDYSRLRPSGRPLVRTGGKASGPIPLMHVINEVGRNVMQGGSRRSAIYASLDWLHEDVSDFLTVKNWEDQYWTGRKSNGWLKKQNFNFPAPLDMTNISLNYNDAWINLGEGKWNNEVFKKNVLQALKTGEPGFSFNFGDQQEETLRNACTEVTSEDDSDVCNLGSINLGNIANLQELKDVVTLASKFLVCGTLRAELPFEKVYKVREKNRRLGLGLMGIHEWLLQRGYRYEINDELRQWLEVYRYESEQSALDHCSRLYISNPVAFRAIAPTGTIGILASTTTGIEPLFATAFKRRYLKNGDRWHYEFVVDATADRLIEELGVKPESIETALTLADDYERRIKFQADIQDYVDMSISSTINLPAWGTEGNNEDRVEAFAKTLAKYAPRLRGFTCYPDGARGGQPLTMVDYYEAKKHRGVVFQESDICDITGKGGTCSM